MNSCIIIPCLDSLADKGTVWRKMTNRMFVNNEDTQQQPQKAERWRRIKRATSSCDTKGRSRADFNDTDLMECRLLCATLRNCYGFLIEVAWDDLGGLSAEANERQLNQMFLSLLAGVAESWSDKVKTGAQLDGAIRVRTKALQLWLSEKPKRSSSDINHELSALQLKGKSIENLGLKSYSDNVPSLPR